MADDSYPGENLLVGGREVDELKTPARQTGGVFLCALSPETGYRPASEKFRIQPNGQPSNLFGNWVAAAYPFSILEA